MFPLWYFPEHGRYYNELTPAQRESLDDHWTRLWGWWGSISGGRYHRAGVVLHFLRQTVDLS